MDREKHDLLAIGTLEPAVPAGSRRRSEYLYDGMSRRVQSTDFTGWNGSAFTTTNLTCFVYSGWNLISELTYSQTHTLTNLFTLGLDLSGQLTGSLRQSAGGIGGLLAVIHGGTTSVSSVYFPAYDGNGNVTDYLDTNGVVVARREYDPFGRTTALTGTHKHAFTHWFSTKALDPAWNLYYYGYRWYSPDLVRWLSRDPLGELGGENLYSYCASGRNEFDSLGLLRLRLCFRLRFRWHGWWGGPGWAARRWVSESHLTTEDFLVGVYDIRDRGYKRHDISIYQDGGHAIRHDIRLGWDLLHVPPWRKSFWITSRWVPVPAPAEAIFWFIGLPGMIQ